MQNVNLVKRKSDTPRHLRSGQVCTEHTPLALPQGKCVLANGAKGYGVGNPTYY